jgi:hypothetical protein
MNSELLTWLYRRLLHDPSCNHQRDCTYSGGLIALIYFYAVHTNHSLRWASDRRHWPIWLQRLKLPSYSQICRRLRSGQVLALIRQINQELRQQLPRGRTKLGDGKAYVVNGFSKDRDATFGKVPDGWARGYKLHAILDAASAAIDAWSISGLARGEATVMRQLVQRLDLRGCVLLCDANYDSNPLYRTVDSCGGRLIAPRRKPGTGLGHRPHHPHRLTAIELLEGNDDRRRAHARHRAAIERGFANLGNSIGLWALPNFVRRQYRVQQWILAKITLYHLHLLLRLSQPLSPAA